MTTLEDLTFPLTYDDGLVYLDMTYPSEADLIKYEWVHITADYDWPRDSEANQITKTSRNEELSSYLLYKPTDVVEKTLKCTTQWAKNVVRATNTTIEGEEAAPTGQC